MQISKKDGAWPLVKDLAESFSIQSKVANRIWLVMLIPIAMIFSEEPSKGKRELPFGLGEVNSSLFDLSILFILVAMVISFTSARAASLIPYDRAHSIFNELEAEHESAKRQREFFSMLSYPSLVRTGPFAVLAETIFGTTGWRRRASVQLYRVTKYAAVLIYLGLPGLALYFSWQKIYEYTDFLYWIIAGFFVLIAITCLLYILRVEIYHTEQIVKKKLFLKTTSE